MILDQYKTAVATKNVITIFKWTLCHRQKYGKERTKISFTCMFCCALHFSFTWFSVVQVFEEMGSNSKILSKHSASILVQWYGGFHLPRILEFLKMSYFDSLDSSWRVFLLVGIFARKCKFQTNLFKLTLDICQHEEALPITEWQTGRWIAGFILASVFVPLTQKKRRLNKMNSTPIGYTISYLVNY